MRCTPAAVVLSGHVSRLGRALLPVHQMQTGSHRPGQPRTATMSPALPLAACCLALLGGLLAGVEAEAAGERTGAAVGSSGRASGDGPSGCRGNAPPRVSFVLGGGDYWLGAFACSMASLPPFLRRRGYCLQGLRVVCAPPRGACGDAALGAFLPAPPCRRVSPQGLLVPPTRCG